jgi:hypothetical protein
MYPLNQTPTTSIGALLRKNAAGSIFALCVGFTFPFWAKPFAACLLILWMLAGGR